jgi:hypothetical protein
MNFLQLMKTKYITSVEWQLAGEIWSHRRSTLPHQKFFESNACLYRIYQRHLKYMAVYSNEKYVQTVQTKGGNCGKLRKFHLRILRPPLSCLKPHNVNIKIYFYRLIYTGVKLRLNFLRWTYIAVVWKQAVSDKLRIVELHNLHSPQNSIMMMK